MSGGNEVIRVRFATGTLGCLLLVMLFFVPLTVWMYGVADPSGGTGRGAAFARWVQSLQWNGLPVGAIAIGVYFLYQAAVTGWRWADQVAVALTAEKLLFHRSLLGKAVDLADLISIGQSYRGSGWFKTINPSIVVCWRDKASGRTRNRMMRNIALDTDEGRAFIERLRQIGKWSGES